MLSELSWLLFRVPSESQCSENTGATPESSMEQLTLLCLRAPSPKRSSQSLSTAHAFVAQPVYPGHCPNHLHGGVCHRCEKLTGLWHARSLQLLGSQSVGLTCTCHAVQGSCGYRTRRSQQEAPRQLWVFMRTGLALPHASALPFLVEEGANARAAKVLWPWNRQKALSLTTSSPSY